MHARQRWCGGGAHPTDVREGRDVREGGVLIKRREGNLCGTSVSEAVAVSEGLGCMRLKKCLEHKRQYKQGGKEGDHRRDCRLYSIAHTAAQVCRIARRYRRLKKVYIILA